MLRKSRCSKIIFYQLIYLFIQGIDHSIASLVKRYINATPFLALILQPGDED